MNNRFVELRKQLGKFVANFSIEDGDGNSFIFEGDEISVGLEVSTYAEDGSVVPLADGEYTIKEKEVIVKDGRIENFKGNGDLLNTEQEVKVEVEQKTETEQEKPAETPQEAPETTESVEQYKHTIEQLQSDCEAKDARIAELEAKVKEYESKSLDAPVPQITNMSDEKPDVSEAVKGTKFEKAARILGS